MVGEDIKLKIENFEGPLDLLLHLIEKKELNIEKIQIHELIEEYLGIIKRAQNNNVTLKVEFLVIASELLEIKALSILSTREKEKKEEELAGRIREYKIFKELSEELKKLEKVYNISYNLVEGEKITRKRARTFDETTLTLTKIYEISKELFNNQIDDSMEINVTKAYDMKDIMDGILKEVEVEKEKKVSEIFKEASSNIHLVYIFLAVLELYRDNLIKVEEDKIIYL